MKNDRGSVVTDRLCRSVGEKITRQLDADFVDVPRHEAIELYPVDTTV